MFCLYDSLTFVQDVHNDLKPAEITRVYNCLSRLATMCLLLLLKMRLLRFSLLEHKESLIIYSSSDLPIGRSI
jgi:hypothetical protein